MKKRMKYYLQKLMKNNKKHYLSVMIFIIWSRWWESNPRILLGRQWFYHWTTSANGAEKGTWTLTIFLPQDFKSCASTIPPLQQLVPHPRFELGTPSLKVKCSTTELVGRLVGKGGFEPPRVRIKIWCLTAWRHPIMVDRVGFEPTKTESTDLQSVAFGHFAIYPFAIID